MVEEEEKGEPDEFYIHFFSDAFLAALVRWLEDRECVSPQEFSALLRSSVEMIAKYVLHSQNKGQKYSVIWKNSTNFTHIRAFVHLNLRREKI